MTAEDEEPASQLRMNLSIPVDGHSCVRRECPLCLLEFKLDATTELMRDVLAWDVSRAMHSYNLGTNKEIENPESDAHCPYCGHSAKSQSFLQPEHWDYIKAVVYREDIEPMVSRMLGSAFSGFKNNSLIRMTYESGSRNPRPMIGPEQTDMVRVRCLACSMLFKVSPAWRGTVRCPSCATDLQAT